MAAIGLGRSEVAPFLQTGVTIGCDNSPGSVTLTGDVDILEGIMKDIQQKFPDILVRSLRVECAYHSCGFSLLYIQKDLPDLSVLQIICLRSQILTPEC